MSGGPFRLFVPTAMTTTLVNRKLLAENDVLEDEVLPSQAVGARPGRVARRAHRDLRPRASIPPAETTPMAFRRPRLSAGEVAYAAKDRLHGAALKVMFDAILERATVDVQGLADRLDRVRDVGLAVRVAHDERGHEQAALDGLLQEERAKGL